MKPKFAAAFVVALVAAGTSARADFFALDIDGQAGYLRLDRIEHPGTFEATTLSGPSAGVRGKIEILFLSLIFDYQHMFSNADYLHAGLGADFKLPLGVVEPYARASAGIMMLAAKGKAFSPEATEDLKSTVGFQLRAGGGLDIPLGDWFAIGAGVDIGYHYITGKSGWDLSAVGYLGLRI
ncbi:MAG: hypothetical protein D6806_11130 [Deltaproteobacteria bacterium]|nr:MAG: hypothetical protein D6806_11130 [Deltaproteobacteria bacterium]